MHFVVLVRAGESKQALVLCCYWYERWCLLKFKWQIPRAALGIMKKGRNRMMLLLSHKRTMWGRGIDQQNVEHDCCLLSFSHQQSMPVSFNRNHGGFLKKLSSHHLQPNLTESCLGPNRTKPKQCQIRTVFILQEWFSFFPVQVCDCFGRHTQMMFSCWGVGSGNTCMCHSGGQLQTTCFVYFVI